MRRTGLRTPPPRLDDSWKDDAACRDADPELFFPTTGGNVEAYAYCAACPVAAECLDYALTVNSTASDWGIWANTNASQRRVLRRERNRAA